ncbi:unnamed protein product [Echinostoma caproni]|uniref:Uncharacterized protein n=1 Tax=Echinostoma caproni TaxID=27848 RepID=A0A3P8DHI4_9TREM|nr:unnamed protein product [Echinostoma caproni]
MVGDTWNTATPGVTGIVTPITSSVVLAPSTAVSTSSDAPVSSYSVFSSSHTVQPVVAGDHSEPGVVTSHEPVAGSHQSEMEMAHELHTATTSAEEISETAHLVKVSTSIAESIPFTSLVGSQDSSAISIADDQQSVLISEIDQTGVSVEQTEPNHVPTTDLPQSDQDLHEVSGINQQETSAVLAEDDEEEEELPEENDTEEPGEDDGLDEEEGNEDEAYPEHGESEEEAEPYSEEEGEDEGDGEEEDLNETAVADGYDEVIELSSKSAIFF